MFWYESIGRKAPRVSYGSISPSVLGDDKCSMVSQLKSIVQKRFCILRRQANKLNLDIISFDYHQVHMISHRYAVAKETTKDMVRRQ